MVALFCEIFSVVRSLLVLLFVCMYLFFFHKCNAFIVWSFVGGGEEPTPGMLIESFSVEISDSELIVK